MVMELCTGGELFDRILEEAEKHEGARSAKTRRESWRRSLVAMPGAPNVAMPFAPSSVLAPSSDARSPQ